MRTFVAMLALFVGTPCMAQGFVVPPPALPSAPNRDLIQLRYQTAMIGLRDEAVAQQKADGGTLSLASKSPTEN